MAKYHRYLMQLRLLMWKQMVLRRNRWIMSTLELLLPIALVVIILKSSEDFVSAKGSEHMNATIYPTTSESEIVKSINFFRCVVYTPNDSVLHDLMSEYKTFFEGKINLDCLLFLTL